MAKNGANIDADMSLCLRAAWLHYAGGLTQAAVAKRLGVPSVKAHRLIARAVAEGAVKITVEGDIVECVGLEVALCDRFGLEFCEVAPDIGEEGLPLRTLGLAGSSYLKRELENGDYAVIGLAHGRTLAAMVQQLPRMELLQQRFVSLLGGLARNFSANPHEVMHRLAEKTGAQAFMMPVPFFANSVEDREVMLHQKGVGAVFEMANSADLKVVGIGTVEPDAQLVSSGMIEPSEIQEIAAAGGRGEMLGHFFDASGGVMETTLTARTLGASMNEGDRIVAIAGGPGKVEAIHAVLSSGKLTGLITDELTAQALLAR
ncbi:sugar-binding transcriptional regulator [Donghicola tyrosinivorans]|uniref:DNA-binding transcriptional regulator LsrR (DeoR family) n=1 Tax=Donghicola tyrosinivorans TaxID=1652492 RepID=A0A2T0WFX7_9RHOB|nr:sugar-binding transcriptional regulator [Donghicola tyrosinivorans]PRY85575.1 DNA-binding transcriptional regulator LsrR (DeoR family) [Donghicola tyrosinivorans]